MRIAICFGILLVNSLSLAAQQENSALISVSQLPDRLFNKINRGASRMDDRISRQTAKYLNRLIKEEKKLEKKLSQKDSAAAKNIFTRYLEKYSGFKSRIESSSDSGNLNPLREYIPGLDNLPKFSKFQCSG